MPADRSRRALLFVLVLLVGFALGVMAVSFGFIPMFGTY